LQGPARGDQIAKFAYAEFALSATGRWSPEVVPGDRVVAIGIVRISAAVASEFVTCARQTAAALGLESNRPRWRQLVAASGE